VVTNKDDFLFNYALKYDTLFCEIFENELSEKWEISRKFRILRTFFSQKFNILLNSVFFHEIFAFFEKLSVFFLLNFRNSEFLAKQIQAKLREKSENFVFRQECEIFAKQFFFFAGNPLFYLKSFFCRILGN